MSPEEYRAAHTRAILYADTASIGWDDRYLAGLYRNGLKLTQSSSWIYVFEFVVSAPRPLNDPELWPQDTWVIPR